MELNQIVGSLKKRDLLPALKWCENNRPALKKRYLCLEFGIWVFVNLEKFCFLDEVFKKFKFKFCQFC